MDFSSDSSSNFTPKRRPVQRRTLEKGIAEHDQEWIEHTSFFSVAGQIFMMAGQIQFCQDTMAEYFKELMHALYLYNHLEAIWKPYR